MLNQLIKYLIIMSAIASAMIFAGFSCIPKNVQTPEPTPSESTAQTENLEPGEALDWSTVAPEDLWEGVFGLYDTDGPKYALALLDRAIENDVVTFEEADQVRAGFLYELGRFDEAFIRLSSYIIDASRPDLLRLRGEVLWGMGRYDEALRDYLTLYNSDPDNASPEILVAINRLHNTLAEWDKASEFRAKLESSNAEGAGVINLALDLYDALQSEDSVRIRNLIPALTENAVGESASDPSVVLATVYAEYLEGDKTSAMQDALDFITNNGFDSNIGLILLKLNVETGEFTSFTSNLRTMLTQLDAIQWLDALPDTYPQPVDQPITVASLLDSASAIELGSGSRTRPRILANRSLMLNPYDYIAYLQLAAVDIVDKDIASAFINLNQALALAPPSDVRTRVRILQFSQFASEINVVPWDSLAIASDLDALLTHLESEYPLNSFNKSSRAELLGFQGDIDGAISENSDAVALPGGTRETALRLGYWLARAGRIEEAVQVIEISIPFDSPYLMWVTAIEQEAQIKADPNLAEFARQIHVYLDPENTHADFFNPVESE